MSQGQYTLQGKKVLITGGSMGIGLACAETCIEAGAQVIICARNKGPLNEAVQQLEQKGAGKVSSLVADVSDLGQVEALFHDVTKQVDRLDGVIHCAGVYGPIGEVTEIDPEEWDGLSIFQEQGRDLYLHCRGQGRRINRPAR